MSFRKIIILFSISLIFGGIENVCFGIGFRSDCLEEISRHVSAVYPHCDSTFIVKSGRRDIMVRVSHGSVEHIGFRIFSKEMRSGSLDPRIADFVERYWLSLTLPLERQKTVSQQMKEDRFVFHVGGIGSIDAIQRDSLLPFSFRKVPNQVSMTWGTQENPVCCISFPVDHELILGRKMLENDRRLPSEIAETKISEFPVAEVPDTDVLSVDSLSMLLIDNSGSYLDCALKSERYYEKEADGATLRPVFDGERCVESVMNLFTGCDIPEANDIRLSVKHQTFGLKEQMIETTVRKFVAYAISVGCKPYAGIVSVGEGPSGSVDVLVIMHNWQVGYNHVLRAEVPVSCLSSGEGVVLARLNAFVPSSSIKNLFKN